MPKLVNFDILANPYNWVKVNLMAMIGLMAIFFVAKLIEGKSNDGTE
jgi:hypothetical protein